MARIRELSERRLPADRFMALVNVPMSREEEREKVALIRWFLRRYPTPEARLAYSRRAYEDARKWMPETVRRQRTKTRRRPRRQGA